MSCVFSEATAAAEQRVKWRLAALTSGLPDLLRNAFNLLSRLSEVRQGRWRVGGGGGGGRVEQAELGETSGKEGGEEGWSRQS